MEFWKNSFAMVFPACFSDYGNSQGMRLELAACAACHLSFLCFDHFFDHVTADRSILFCGKITVVSVAKWDSKLICNFILKTFQ